MIRASLDHFKQINDVSGHDTGDLALKEVAALLMRHIRGSDIACRYGGEEFALILPDVTPEGAWLRAEDIRTSIKRLALEHHGKSLRITASLGIALFPDHAGDTESLIRASDESLYEAKRAGRDRVVARKTARKRATGPVRSHS